jgi:sensor histidine kinase YesM
MNPSPTVLWADWFSWQVVVFMLQLISIRFIFEILYCYSVIYWLLPKYLVKEKYVKFGLWLVLISILYNALVHGFMFWFSATPYAGFLEMSVRIFSNFIMWIGFPTCILLIAYKMLKFWYLREEEKTALVIGNTYAELQLLKAQVHPHFLFNTLNNIYSFTLDKSPLAGELVSKLSHILHYMTKECDMLLVPLDKEIKILNDYIDLEKVRYGTRLDLQVKINGITENKLIAPLLMISFVENSFKHGASKTLEDSFINLNIQVSNEKLFFCISNNKPLLPQKTNEKKALGLNNVTRRLKLLYPTTHELKIKSDAHFYCVEMMVILKTNQIRAQRPDSELIMSKSKIPANVGI